MPPKRDPPSLEESMAAIADNLSKLLSGQNELTKLIANQPASITKLDHLTTSLSAVVTKLEKRPTDAFENPPPPPPPEQNTVSPKSPKILLPVVDGSAPLDWLFQADQYFRFYKIPPEQRISIIAFHLKGDALSWYKYLHNNRLLTDWTAFTRALELRFGPSSFENHQATLFKLRQTGSVSHYQTEFERVSNCVIGLSPEALLNCFVSGLRIDIQQELSLHNPSSIHQAYGLSKLIEDKLAAISPHNSSGTHLAPFSPSPSPPSSTSTTPAILPTPPQPPTALPLRRLTPEEVRTRRSLGLCFRCSEKYHSGHRCNPPQFLLLESTEEIPTSIPIEPDPGFPVNGLEGKAIF